MARKTWPTQSEEPQRRALTEPIMSPTSCASSGHRDDRNRRSGCAIRCSTNSPPTRSHCWHTTPSFSNPERTPMTPLEQKRQQLNLKARSRQIEATIADAAARNLSVSATLELLADMELEARHSRAIERRFKCSRLQSQPSIDAFHFHHHKSRTQAKTRILRLLDLTFLKQGTNLVLIGNPGVGKTFLARVFGWKACQANQRVVFTTAMDMLNHLLASQVDHSLVRKLKTFTEPTLLIVDELGYLSLDQQTSNLFYQVISTRHSQKRSTIITTNRLCGELHKRFNAKSSFMLRAGIHRPIC